MRWLLLIVLAFCAPLPAKAEPQTHKGDCVVMLHGLARGAWEMAYMAHKLREDGFTVYNLSYPSLRWPIGVLALEQVAPQLPVCSGRTHFVAHSMGGLVVRAMLGHVQAVPKVGNIVLIGTPNHGSQWANTLLRTPLLRTIYATLMGPAAVQLNTYGLPQRLPHLDGYHVGTIAGERPGLVSSLILPSPHDGKVSVASTHLPGEADHVTVRSGHDTLLFNQTVIKHTETFLRRGRFMTY